MNDDKFEIAKIIREGAKVGFFLNQILEEDDLSPKDLLLILEQYQIFLKNEINVK